MCDTILASPQSTAEASVLFGKNSDRQRNEARAIEYVPARNHRPDARIDCTYITIPQVPHTRAVLLCRPFWIGEQKWERTMAGEAAWKAMNRLARLEA